MWILRGGEVTNLASSARYFPEVEGTAMVSFGKYRGMALSQLVKEDPDYCGWILDTAAQEDAGHLLQQAAKWIKENHPDLQVQIQQSKENVDGDTVVTFGKHKGLTFKAVLEEIMRNTSAGSSTRSTTMHVATRPRCLVSPSNTPVAEVEWSDACEMRGIIPANDSIESREAPAVPVRQSCIGPVRLKTQLFLLGCLGLDRRTSKTTVKNDKVQGSVLRLGPALGALDIASLISRTVSGAAESMYPFAKTGGCMAAPHAMMTIPPRAPAGCGCNGCSAAPAVPGMPHAAFSGIGEGGSGSGCGTYGVVVPPPVRGGSAGGAGCPGAGCGFANGMPPASVPPSIPVASAPTAPAVVPNLSKSFMEQMQMMEQMMQKVQGQGKAAPDTDPMAFQKQLAQQAQHQHQRETGASTPQYSWMQPAQHEQPTAPSAPQVLPPAAQAAHAMPVQPQVAQAMPAQPQAVQLMPAQPQVQLTPAQPQAVQLTPAQPQAMPMAPPQEAPRAPAGSRSRSRSASRRKPRQRSPSRRQKRRSPKRRRSSRSSSRGSRQRSRRSPSRRRRGDSRRRSPSRRRRDSRRRSPSRRRRNDRSRSRRRSRTPPRRKPRSPAPRRNFGGGGGGGGSSRPPTPGGGGAGKPAGGAGGTERPGDWSCPNCGAMVFASKSECFKCHTKKDIIGLSTATRAGASPYSRHVKLTKIMVQEAATKLGVQMTVPLTRDMQKEVSDAAKEHWSKGPKQAADEDAAASEPASASRGRGKGRGKGRGRGNGTGKGRAKAGGKGGAKGRGKGRGKAGGKGVGAKLRRAFTKKVQKPKARAAPKDKAHAKATTKRKLAEAEVPASMEHPVDRFNAQLRDLEDDKGQEYDDTKKTWGKVSEELKLKLKPLIYKLEKPLEHL
eukprot:s4834_g1.t1